MNDTLPRFPLGKPSFRRRASLVAVLLMTVVGRAADVYVTPNGAGTQDGTSWANAYPQSQIQTAVNNLAAGDTLNLGSGTYSITSFSISGSGTSTSPKRIHGVDTGSGDPLFQGTFNVANSASSSFISFPGEANHWVIKNLRFKNQPFVIDMPLNGTTDTLRSNITFENLAFDSIEDAIRIRNANNITVKNCHVIRHTKKAFRIGKYSSFVTFDSCTTDCNGGDDSFPSRSIPNGFAGDATASEPIIHDITFIDCTARNNRFTQSADTYWNGDGFATERGTYNVTYIRCKSFDNHDGGFDDKANGVTYQDCIAAGNKRGFRCWGGSGTMFNCVSPFNKSWGGTGSANGVWVSGNGGNLAIDFSTFHNNASTQVYAETNAVLTVANSIISTDSSTVAFASSNVTLESTTVTYRPGSGTDPNYVNPVSTWRGSPANSMDSQTYGTTKGYHSTDATNAPPSLTISATPTSGTAPLTVDFTATATDSDGSIASYSWDFKNGETSTLQNPTTTYSSAGTFTPTCTVTDNLGATTTKSVTITVSAPPGETAPTFVAAGPVATSPGAVTVSLPSGVASGDILLLFVETAAETSSISNPNGGTWGQVTGSPQGTGSAGSPGATQLTVFWSRYDGSQGAPTVADSGNHQLARMIAIRGAVASGTPWDVTAGGVEATSDTSASIPGTTTTVANTLVVLAVAASGPDQKNGTTFSGWTNANLTNLTERADNTTSSGNGGALGIATGEKAAAGAYGTTSVTLGTAAVKAMISIAIKG